MRVDVGRVGCAARKARGLEREGEVVMRVKSFPREVREAELTPRVARARWGWEEVEVGEWEPMMIEMGCEGDWILVIGPDMVARISREMPGVGVCLWRGEMEFHPVDHPGWYRLLSGSTQPYFGAMMVGMTRRTPSTSMSCLSSWTYWITTDTKAPAGMFPMLVVKISVVPCSRRAATFPAAMAALYVAFASSFGLTMPVIVLSPTCAVKEVTALDS